MTGKRQGLTALTVEDDRELRHSIATYLEDSGFTVYEAANGIEGLHIFRTLQPDIVFTDLAMPQGHGLDLIPVIRLESPHTPIVVISGTGLIDDVVEAMKRGAWDFIVKPVRELADLEKVSRELIARSRKRRNVPGNTDDAQEPNEDITGLPDISLRKEPFERLSGAQDRMCLIVLDLDKFKVVNATFGRRTCEKLLRQVAGRLEAVRGDNDVLVHLGGDEFAIITTASEALVQSLVASLKDAFREPYLVDGKELFLSASMGVVRYPHDGGTIDELIRCANISTCLAKEQGRNNVHYYNPTFGTHVRNRMELETSMRHALEREEFTLVYQPQVEIPSGMVTGVETLLRWQRSDGTLVLPSEFIPVLEESGLIIPVGEWILKRACAQYVAWQSQGAAPFTLSVNISAPQFKSGGLPATVIRILQETGMDPAKLCLELTESIVMDDIGETIRTLETLRELGISLSIDDFGTGYSSLNYLRMMPISELKIDRSFIATIAHDQNNATLVTTIISMAQCMNMRVVAEGVETAEQLDHLASRQCRTVQGFYFSKPLRAEDLARYLAYGTGAVSPHPATR